MIAGADAVHAAAIGLFLGAATGIPLGIVNVAVVEAAARSGRRRAIGIGIGGALADSIHASLAFAGVAPLLARNPALVRILAAASAVVIAAYAVRVWRARPAPVEPGPSPPGTFRRAVALGLALTLPNPAPLLAWIAVAGAVLSDATPALGAIAAAGVGLGSAAWFAALAHVAARGALGGRTARWLPRVVAIALVVIAVLSAVRAALG